MRKHLAAIKLFLLLGISTVKAEERYPFYFPEWLWRDDHRYAQLVDRETASKWAELRLRAEKLVKGDLQEEADLAEDEARRLLHSQLSSRDFLRGAEIVEAREKNRAIALHLDPSFPEPMKGVMKRGVEIYLQHATDPAVVKAAYRNSIEQAEPFPPEIIDGEPNRDYWLFSTSVSKPRSEASFTEQLETVLHPKDGSTPLLIISAYSGNPWWGGGIYDAYYSPRFQLSRIAQNGYLYIRLNTDKMVAPSERFNDPAFWASKIAHEILHNLGYWHPSFADPAERDKVSQPGKMAFLVAYERAFLAVADAEKNN
jgi:hypothetical protein